MHALFATKVKQFGDVMIWRFGNGGAFINQHRLY